MQQEEPDLGSWGHLATDLLLEVWAQGHGQRLRHERSGEDVRRMGTTRSAAEALKPADTRPTGVQRVKDDAAGGQWLCPVYRSRNEPA